MSTIWEYEFDPYGDNPNNLVKNEYHTITPANGKNFNFFIPRKGPYHRRSLKVFSVAANGAETELRIGSDYYFGWRFDQIITSGAVQPVYGAVVLNDPTKALRLKIQYQNLGGPFVFDDQEIAQLLANTLRDPRRALYTDVMGIPDELPPIAHRQSTGDLVGFDASVEALYKLAAAVGDGNVKAMQALMEHIKDHHNPHKITLADLGIDQLGNLIPATKEEAESGTDASHYMTSQGVKYYADAKIIPVIDAHKADKNNPHNTDKTQVGLGLVQNYGVATNVEAQAGVATNRYMTPASTKSSVMQFAPESMLFHTTNTNNPHNTTKAHVGLSMVQNYRVATREEALAGSSNELYMTPYLVAQLLTDSGSQSITAHINNKNNPHEVTASQVGLGLVNNYGLATDAEAQTGTSKVKYMTPYLTSLTVASYINANVISRIAANEQTVSQHIANRNNPHGTTKNHVGLGQVQNYGVASDADISSLSNTAYMTPLATSKMVSGSMNTRIIITMENLNPATMTQVPYPAAQTELNNFVEALLTGFKVNSGMSNTTGATIAFSYGQYSFTGTESYTMQVKNYMSGYRFAIPLFTMLPLAGGNRRFFGVAVGAGRLVYVEITPTEIIPLTTGVNIPSTLAATLNFTVTTNGTNNTATVVLNNSGTNYSLAVTYADLAIEAGIAIVADYTISPIFGLASELDTTMYTTENLTVSTNYLPTASGALIYDPTDRDKYSYDGRKWIVGTGDAANDRIPIALNKGATYWNYLTDELFLAVSESHVIPFGMSSIVP